MAIDLSSYRERFEKIAEALKDTKRLVVLTHDNPDPDALSSALTLAYIVRHKYKIPAVVRYGGIVGRAENRAMIRVLKLRVAPFGEKDLRRGTDYAFVDMQPHTGNSSFSSSRKPAIIIDHHSLRKSTRADYMDLRIEYGATATILTEYLLASGLEISWQLATALSYGISSETQDLGREARATDIHAYLALFPLSNKKLLAHIEHPKLPREYFITLNRAMHHTKIYKNVVTTLLGEVENPDFVAFIADSMLRCERMTWAMCVARYQNRIVVSIRTTNIHARAGLFLRQLIGKKGTAGGHGMIAGGQIICSSMEHEQCTKIEEELVQNFLKKLGHSADAQTLPLLITEPIR